jgi:hypothetical protein
MNNEILAFVKFLMSAKANIILFEVLAVLIIAVVVTVNGNTISNSINGQQASAINIISANSLANIIKEKVASAINKSIDVNNQQSTQSNCVNNKCITTICVNNECHTTTTTTNDGAANSASINIGTITIGEPFFKQDDKRISQKAVIINGTHASEVSFAGSGRTNGISFTDTGKALVVPKGGGVTYIQGRALIKTNVTDEKATYTFLEIGKSGADGTLKASGAAFFGSDATGKLAFLNNTVAIYKDQIDKAGNGKVIAWRWQ